MQRIAPAAPSPISFLWERALDLLFPPRCVSCREFGAFLCHECLLGVSAAGEPRCKVCWMPVEGGPPCTDCRSRRPAFTSARAAFVYEGAVRDAVHALKFRGISALAPVMARCMAEALSEWQLAVEVIVPVPLTGHRRRMRGYNQAELLARELARLTDIPVQPRALTRVRSGVTQVSQPDREARRRNVSGAFALGRKRIEGPVLLVDDVMTTGATLDACARVLVSVGAGPVYALTFARDS